jgi:hypothetical protein
MVFDRPDTNDAASCFVPSDRRGVVMSDPGSAETKKPAAAKKRVSPARNAIGLVVLVSVLVVGWVQYTAKAKYNAAVTAVDARSQDEEKGLLTDSEAEKLFGRSPDGPGTNYQDADRVFTKKTYTWRGLLKSYTVTAFYTKEPTPHLHHFATEGAKDTSESAAERQKPASATTPAKTSK